MQIEFSESSLRDRVLMLRAMEALEALDDDSLSLLAEYAKPRTYAKGEVLLRDDEPIESVFMVLDGQVRVTRLGKLLATVRRSYGVGFVSTLARDPHGISAVAEEATQALALPRSALLDAIEESWTLLRNSIRLAAISVRKLEPLPVVSAETVGANDPSLVHEQSFVERVIGLRRIPIFANCNLDAVNELARRGVEVRGAAEDILWQRGALAKSTLAIQSGLLRCTGPDGDSVLVGRDQQVGMWDILAAEPRGYTLVAESAYVVLKIEQQTLLAVLEAHHTLAMDIQAMLLTSLLEGN